MFVATFFATEDTFPAMYISSRMTVGLPLFSFTIRMKAGGNYQRFLLVIGQDIGVNELLD